MLVSRIADEPDDILAVLSRRHGGDRDPPDLRGDLPGGRGQQALHRALVRPRQRLPARGQGRLGLPDGAHERLPHHADDCRGPRRPGGGAAAVPGRAQRHHQQPTPPPPPSPPRPAAAAACRQRPAVSEPVEGPGPGGGRPRPRRQGPAHPGARRDAASQEVRNVSGGPAPPHAQPRRHTAPAGLDRPVWV